MITHHSSLEVFYEQLEFVQREYRPHGLKAKSFSNVVIGGLGGSGIGGTITKSYFIHEFPIPVEVINDYFLPAYVDSNSLVVLGSYSGNTEETLSMLEDALKRSAKVLIICSGGHLMEKAKELNLIHYAIEQGYQPRMALGYSLGFLLKVFGELIGKDLTEDFNSAIAGLSDNVRLKQAAENLVTKFQSTLNRRYTILTDAAFSGIAWRFAQQLNENSKMEAFVSTLPEANHNVIESYYGQLPSNFIVLNSHSNERVSARFDFITALLERENNKVAVLETQQLDIPTLFEIIYILDWFTINITEPLNVDPMQIANIISLKEFLSEI
ncbi:MAG: bifunctional phosphoglucose/phosphomannose isomerase [Bacteroidetes bacterium]|nr:bifunctional phosphoglucose/phosphomannose isomerase [Bacteroidota bacterium]